MRYIVQFHDQIHDVDAFANLDLGPIADPAQAKALVESDFDGCHFEVRRVDPVVCIHLETGAEANLTDYLAQVGNA